MELPAQELNWGTYTSHNGRKETYKQGKGIKQWKKLTKSIANSLSIFAKRILLFIEKCIPGRLVMENISPIR